MEFTNITHDAFERKSIHNGGGFATPVEAARYLGLSKGMIHKLIGQGEIPAQRFGRAVRIPWRWLEEKTFAK